MFVGRKLDTLPDSLTHLIGAIQAFKVTHLYMSDNAFGPNGVVKFNKQLATSFEHLTHLHLLNCGLGPEGTEMIANALIENGNIKLKCLFISRNRVENKGAAALARYFKTNDQLSKLLIYQNGMRKEAFRDLMPSLIPSAQSGALEFLDINDNLTEDHKSAVEAIVEFIGAATNLRTLSLSDSSIQTPKNQFKIIEALKQSPCAGVFEELYWNFDIQHANVAVKILNDILTSLPKIKKVKMIGTIHKKETRDELRELFRAKGAQLLLSDWEQQKEELMLEGKEIDEEDIFSDDGSEEEWNEEDDD